MFAKFLSALALSTFALSAHAANFSCHQNANGTFQPFNKDTWHLIGRDGTGYVQEQNCMKAIANARNSLVCVSNGDAIVPHNVPYDFSIGDGDKGFNTTVDCINSTMNSTPFAVCKWNGFYYQPHSIKTGSPIGARNDGYVHIENCYAAVMGSSYKHICSADGDGSRVYDLADGERTSMWFDEVNKCNAFIDQQEGAGPWARNRPTPPTPPAPSIETGSRTVQMTNATFFKATTGQASSLSGSQKCALPAGKSLEVFVHGAEGNHARVTLQETIHGCAFGNSGTVGFLYIPYMQ